MIFRPCIDLHEGKVKQIVGSTLSDQQGASPVTNFCSEHEPSWFSKKYKEHNLQGGHIIKLGAGNDEAALSALSAWPQGMQIGGGINDENAFYWIEHGASAVIVTSFVFRDGKIHDKNLQKIVQAVGKEKLVLDLSCRKKDGEYKIVTDRWTQFTDVTVNEKNLDFLSQFCFEFLIHAVDVEGMCNGIELELVKKLGKWGKIPITYAGGIQSDDDIQTIQKLGHNKIDFTVGSALDLFGGNKLCYSDMLQYSSK
ncbi:MAG: phosphoribosylformimino-5-aminoimidazole carboxamide ribotide isomerase [bacterium]|jgi:phosphoribosylformimino-5-aminoimidazole carboxamide ribotide isomerase